MTRAGTSLRPLIDVSLQMSQRGAATPGCAERRSQAGIFVGPGAVAERTRREGGPSTIVRPMTTLYLVRHCHAAGQAPEAPLTEQGLAQAERLADFLAPLEPDRIVSSPFRRAVQSVEPLSARLDLPIDLDERLRERQLTTAPGDWMEHYRRSFDDVDAVLEGGESTRAALARAAAAIEAILAAPARTTVVASHGNLSTLILRHFDGRAGFAEWRAMTTPDVFRIAAGRAERIWS